MLTYKLTNSKTGEPFYLQESGTEDDLVRIWDDTGWERTILPLDVLTSVHKLHSMHHCRCSRPCTCFIPQE